MAGRGQRENYSSAANLQKRQAIFAFVDPERSRGRPAIERIDWTGHEVVLDAGCGNGIWTRALTHRFHVGRATGLDLSLGMLEDARRQVGPQLGLTAGDLMQLPFADETFDVVLCFWMLYHVPDHDAALREVRRVLRPGGRVLATTNRAPLGSLGEVTAAAVSEVLGRPLGKWLPPFSFSAENGADILGAFFDPVEPEEQVTGFAVPRVETVIEILQSSRGPIEIYLGEPVDWDAVEARAAEAIRQTIADQGAFHTEMASVSFLAYR
jgi:ubiquinone/menaquinone biosynthesis C-methylase UbiE